MAWDLEIAKKAFEEAATNPSHWPLALQSLTKCTESHGAILFPVTGGPDFGMPHTEEMGPSLDAYFRDKWCQRDERYKGVSTLMAKGVVDDLDIFNAEALAHHAYYQEFLAPFKLKWFAGLKVAVGEDVWCISLQRRSDQDPFLREEKRRLANLAQSISSAAALAQALSFAAVDAALEAFEASNKPVVLVDGIGEVVRMNACAEKLLGDDVMIINRQIVGVDRVATNTLKRLVVDLTIGRGVTVPMPVVFRRAFRRPILAYALMLNRPASYFFANCKVAIILADLERPMETSEQGLRNVFNMTACEARLTSRLMSGETLENVADGLGISKETARRHLQSIFNKTAVNRQSELVALLGRLVT
ncbi:helix-turn-helix transcriptional regulator [Bradyrhizobium sp. RDM4]|uniref:helix-turn-helix transcriptional regulator n=1 Tax=Bradyrhizobium sp. RDM4 TaxID=3378765 RepID=UPI0038FC31C2